MSLIHEALKKAEHEKSAGAEEHPFIPSHPVIPDAKSPSIRKAVLVALLIACLGLWATSHFVRQAKPPAIPQPLSTPLLSGGPEGADQLERRALESFEKNRLAESRAAWDKLILLRPTDATLYNNLGLVLKKMEKREDAYQAYNQALALKEDYPEALNNRGVLSLADGNQAVAKADFQKAVTLQKDYTPPFLHLAMIFEHEGNIPQARLHYETFLKQASPVEDSLRKKVEAKLNSLKAP